MFFFMLLIGEEGINVDGGSVDSSVSLGDEVLVVYDFFLVLFFKRFLENVQGVIKVNFQIGYSYL